LASRPRAAKKALQARRLALIQHEWFTQHGGNRLAREVVVGRSQPANRDDAVGAF
jgi:hypothetical protein